MRLLDYSHDELPWDEEERWRQILAAEEIQERRQEDRADGERVSACPYWDPVEDPDAESPVERKIREFRARHRRETLRSRLRSWWWRWRTEKGSGA